MWARRTRRCRSTARRATIATAQPDHALLIAVQDTPSLDLYDANGNAGTDGVADTPDGIPEPFEGLGKGKALTAGNAAGTGYITVAYNNDSSLGGLPVSLQVIKVECAKNSLGEESPYRGNLLVIKSDNLFDEKLTIRHTGDFGGRPDNFTFDWWIAAVDDTGVSPKLSRRATRGRRGPRRRRARRRWGRRSPSRARTPPRCATTGSSCATRTRPARSAATSTPGARFAGDPSAKPSEVEGPTGRRLDQAGDQRAEPLRHAGGRLRAARRPTRRST